MPTKLSKYEYNKLFRERIIALCFIPGWFTKYGYNVIRPEFLETDTEQKLVEFIVNFYKKYRRVPEEDEVLAGFENDDNVQELLFNVIDLIDSGEDLSFAEDNTVQFAREQAMKLAVLDSMRDIENGYYSRLIPRAKEALLVGQDLTDLGINLKEDIDKWLVEDVQSEKIPTGIKHLDNALGGGLGRGEYGVFLGSTNIGKTQTLVNVGAGAASQLKKAKVLHISLEMSAKKIARRYGAKISDKWYTEEIGYNEYVANFNKMAKLRTPGTIIIKQYSPRTADVGTIEDYLDRLEVNGFIPDLLIIDYPDIMRHEHVGEYRHNISHTTMMLRSLATERNMAIWGASQANRSALNREIVDLDMIAEDYGKVQIADIVLAVCQTKEEYETELIRFFAAKVRDGEKNWIVRCKQHPEQHAIESIELLTFSDMLEERKERASKKFKDEKEEENKERAMEKLAKYRNHK